MASDYPIRLGMLLRQAHRRAAVAADEALSEFGVSGRHLGVLTALRDGPLSQQELVTALRSDKASMVRSVDHLENLGYVQRAPVREDRRLHAVSLTARGRTVLHDAIDAARAMAEELTSGFTPAERETFVELLGKFVGEH